MSTKETISLCDPYVWEDPRYLFSTKLLTRSGGGSQCASELVNEIVLIYLLSILIGAALGAVFEYSGATLIAGVAATVYLIPVFMKLQTVDGFRSRCGVEGFASNPVSGCPAPRKMAARIPMEGFQESMSIATVSAPADMNALDVPGVGEELRVQTSARNPFNNVLVDEIKYAPTREAAADITTTERKVALDEFFRVQWYSDPTDVFGRNQSQREFVTQPSTTIPNDQESYQNWLYKIPGKTCKEGNPKACYGGTDGGALPWMNL